MANARGLIRCSSVPRIFSAQKEIPMTFPVDHVRSLFPALNHPDRIYADNPAGTQVPATVAQAVADRMLGDYANLGGHFATSQSCDTLYTQAHTRAATFLGAASGREVIIGPSMTALTFHMSRSICRDFQPGDEIVITRMEHEGNVGPWLQIAHDMGLVIRWVAFDPDSWRVEPEALAKQLTTRTRLVCLNHASNMTGSINDIAALSAVAKDAGALVFVDSVQYAPHLLPDVQALGCDFLVCSAYKFFGPHLGLLWGREDLMQSLHPYKGRCVSDDLPDRFESGTPQLELLAGLCATFDYFENLGTHLDHTGSARDLMQATYAASLEYEHGLTRDLIRGLTGIDGLTIYGITNPNRTHDRVPTVSLRVEGHTPSAIAATLAQQGIYVWHGHNYAYEPTRQLGLPEAEGVVRIGLSHYNTQDEVARIVTSVAEAVGA